MMTRRIPLVVLAMIVAATASAQVRQAPVTQSHLSVGAAPTLQAGAWTPSPLALEAPTLAPLASLESPAPSPEVEPASPLASLQSAEAAVETSVSRGDEAGVSEHLGALYAEKTSSIGSEPSQDPILGAQGGLRRALLKPAAKAGRLARAAIPLLGALSMAATPETADPTAGMLAVMAGAALTAGLYFAKNLRDGSKGLRGAAFAMTLLAATILGLSGAPMLAAWAVLASALGYILAEVATQGVIKHVGADGQEVLAFLSMVGTVASLIAGVALMSNGMAVGGIAALVAALYLVLSSIRVFNS